MAKISILGKVYDEYENYDFTPYDNNLNPIREVSLLDSKITIDEGAIYQKIKDRVEKIKQQIQPILQDPEIEEPDIAPFGGEGTGLKGLPEDMVDALNNSGGPRGPGLFGLFGPNGNSPFVQDPLQLEIDLLLAMIPNVPSSNSSNDNEGLEGLIDPDSGELSLFTVDCTGVEETFTVDVGGGGNSNDADGLDQGDASNEGGEAGLAGDGNQKDKDGKAGAEGGKEGDRDDLDSELMGLLDKLNDKDDNDERDMMNDMAECAGKELGILKIILIILKVITVLKKIVAFVLGIIVPIMDIVQLAAGAWINPTNIAKIAQRIAQRLIAMAISLVGMMIQKLWDSLGLDCLVEQVEEILDQIREAMSGVMSIFAEINQLAIDFSPNKLKEMFIDPFKEVERTLKSMTDPETYKTALQQWVGDAKDAGAKLKAQYTSPSTYQNAAMAALPPGAIKAVSLMKKTQADAKKAAKVITKMQLKGDGGFAEAISDMQDLVIY